MDSITYEEFSALFRSFEREALHLEMRDSYGTAVELPHLHKWEADEPDDTDWLQPWFDLVRAGTRAGKVFRRACLVSEPISDYQKWAFKDTPLFVAAGEDIRWVPRRRVSTVALPGNDFLSCVLRQPTRSEHRSHLGMPSAQVRRSRQRDAGARYRAAVCEAGVETTRLPCCAEARCRFCPLCPFRW